MKLKVRPEDFVVEEIIERPLVKNGRYTILKLQKKYWNTLDVIDLAARKRSVSRDLFSRAGLKDRYSLSTQYLSFKGDFKGVIKEDNFILTPIGKSEEPILPNSLVGNRFKIVLRSLDIKDLDRIAENYSEIESQGFPNYFDDQRFGSARHHQGFFAKKLILEHYKGALKLLLCHPYREDGKSTKLFKNHCLQNWGRWEECFMLAPREFRRIIGFLMADPKDYRGAIKTIDKEMLNLYLLAYQSYIFNQTLFLLVTDQGVGSKITPYSIGDFKFYKKLKNESVLKKLKIPMVNEKTKLTGAIGAMIKSILKEEGVEQKQFALGKMRFRGVRFKDFLRTAIVFAKELSIGKSQDDELYQGKKKINLEFILRPGSYATILIKRLLI